MKYVSIDIETLGDDPESCDTLEFSAVADDLTVQAPLDELPQFQMYLHKEVYHGKAYAIAMHADKFDLIANWRENIKVCKLEDLMAHFFTFLTTKAKYIPRHNEAEQQTEVWINSAGKNFATFDVNFLKRIPGYNNKVKFNKRILDPGAFYLDPSKDVELPSTEECMKRAGIDSEKYELHNALDDALIVVELIRKKFPLNNNSA